MPRYKVVFDLSATAEKYISAKDENELEQKLEVIGNSFFSKKDLHITYIDAYSWKEIDNESSND